MKTTREKNKSLRWGVVYLVMCIVTALSFSGIATVSKYVLSVDTYRQADAKAFYFSGDLLVEGDTPVYQIANFVPGTDTIDFNLRNYEDAFHVSETDITYTITTNNASVIGETGSIALNGTTSVDKTISLSVPAAAFTGKTATIRVTATANTPYTTTLAAVFELHRRSTDIQYSVYDAENNNTVTLTVTTGDDAENLTVSFPTAVFPDRTDGRLTFDGSNPSCSFAANANAQYSFVFFKSNPLIRYATSDFSVTRTV